MAEFSTLIDHALADYRRKYDEQTASMAAQIRRDTGDREALWFMEQRDADRARVLDVLRDHALRSLDGIREQAEDAEFERRRKAGCLWDWEPDRGTPRED